jgi:serine/threonine protein kinase
VRGRRRDLEPGDRLGPYELERELGEGASGVVFRALREPDGTTVAVKVLRPGLSRDPVYRQRFLREARIANQVQHRHLVPVLDAGEHDGFTFLASAFFDGGSLADLLAADGRLALGECVRLALEISGGLAALHERGIVHRDVKPGNVMLDRHGTSALTDFGLAKGAAYTVLTRPGQWLGTLDYLAPELIEGSEATPGSDIYALGCLVYECVTGAAPFSERRALEVAVAHLEDEPRSPRERRDTVSEELSWAILRALAKDPAQRPPTARSFARIVNAASKAG